MKGELLGNNFLAPDQVQDQGVVGACIITLESRVQGSSAIQLRHMHAALLRPVSCALTAASQGHQITFLLRPAADQHPRSADFPVLPSLVPGSNAPRSLQHW